MSSKAPLAELRLVEEPETGLTLTVLSERAGQKNVTMAHRRPCREPRCRHRRYYLAERHPSMTAGELRPKGEFPLLNTWRCRRRNWLETPRLARGDFVVFGPAPKWTTFMKLPATYTSPAASVPTAWA